MTLHSSTENSLAVLNHKIMEANSQVQNVKLGGHQTCLSINRLWHELCDMLRRLVGTTAPGHHDSSIQEWKINSGRLLVQRKPTMWRSWSNSGLISPSLHFDPSPSQCSMMQIINSVHVI
ncbi:uncharacterized protein TNCV_3921521 [Trichonephila clavipes]|nr:uncharacterized protein TNCV_3921521 [Trichonephila clavipes]